MKLTDVLFIQNSVLIGIICSMKTVVISIPFTIVARDPKLDATLPYLDHIVSC